MKEKDLSHHSEDTREEKAIATLAPVVNEEGNGKSHNKSGGIGRNRHELCTNRTTTHTADDGGCNAGRAEKDIAREEGYNGKNENHS